MTEEELLAACATLGVYVAYIPYHLAGAYFHQEQLIIIDARLPPARLIETLAHEYTHATLGHDGCQPHHIETKVDKYAAQLLISPAEYALAEHLYGTDTYAIADELGVTPETIQHYQHTLTT